MNDEQYIEYYMKKAQDGLQFLEEMGGPTEPQYVEVMTRLIKQLEIQRDIVIERIRAESPAPAMIYLGAWGFEPYNTGGGCMAFHRTLPGDRYCLITELSDACMPDQLDTPVTLGFYREGEPAEDAPYVDCGTSRGAIVALIAYEFAWQLHQRATGAQWDQMLLSNVTYDPGTCASHDWCDANMVMDEVFDYLGDEDAKYDEEGHLNDGRIALWNEAWAIATPKYLTKGGDCV